MDIIKDELQQNGVDEGIIPHIMVCLNENVLEYSTGLYHDGLYLPNVYNQLQPTNFGRTVVGA